MANNFDKLTQAVERVAESVNTVAEEIRNPAVDNNDQSVIDDLAGRLESAADTLNAAAGEEVEEDKGGLGVLPETSTESPAPSEPAVTDNGQPNEA